MYTVPLRLGLMELSLAPTDTAARRHGHQEQGQIGVAQPAAAPAPPSSREHRPGTSSHHRSWRRSTLSMSFAGGCTPCRRPSRSAVTVGHGRQPRTVAGAKVDVDVAVQSSSSMESSCMRETLASPSTESFTMPTSVAFSPSAISRVLVEPPSSMVTSVKREGERRCRLVAVDGDRQRLSRPRCHLSCPSCQPTPRSTSGTTAFRQSSALPTDF